jgi:hypothetical protein
METGFYLSIKGIAPSSPCAVPVAFQQTATEA